jgi:hypothetical protein
VTTVTVPEVGDVEAGMKVVAGGRLRLRVRDANGLPVRETPELMGARGKAVLRVLEEERPGEVAAALKPGRYSMRVNGKKVSFEVGVGETVRRDVIVR